MNCRVKSWRLQVTDSEIKENTNGSFQNLNVAGTQCVSFGVTLDATCYGAFVVCISVLR